MGGRKVGETAAGFAVDGAFRSALEGGAALPGFPFNSYVVLALKDLHLGQRQDLLLARNLDPHKSSRKRLPRRRSDRGRQARDDKVARLAGLRQGLQPQRLQRRRAHGHFNRVRVLLGS